MSYTPDFYPSLLRPTNFELFVVSNNAIEIPEVVLKFEKWEGAVINNTFGGKPVVDFKGEPMFAELAIMKLFIESGWQARWIETYGASTKKPFHFSNWIDGKLSEQNVDLIEDDAIIGVLNDVSILNSNSYSGCWDVIGWCKDRIIFAESKRTRKDRIRKTQNNWLLAGLNYGLKADNFLVVQWDF